MRAITTATAAQPALTMAAPTWSAPYQSVSPISTDMPTNQTINVACLPDGIYSLKKAPRPS